MQLSWRNCIGFILLSMKYSLLGFNQAKVLDIPNIDIQDLIILRWVMDLFSRASSIRKEVNGNTMVWVKYDTLLEDIPMLGIQKRSLELRFSKLVKSGLLLHYHDKTNGSFSYYAVTSLLENLIYDNEGCEKNFIGGMKNFAEGGTKKIADQKLTTKNTYIENNRKENIQRKDEFFVYLLGMGVDEQNLKDWLEVRKARKAPMTWSAIKMLEREALKAGKSVAEVVQICAERGWQGFKANYMARGLKDELKDREVPKHPNYDKGFE